MGTSSPAPRERWTGRCGRLGPSECPGAIAHRGDIPCGPGMRSADATRCERRAKGGDRVLGRRSSHVPRLKWTGPCGRLNPKTRVGPGGASQPHDRYFITRPRRMGKGRIASAARHDPCGPTHVAVSPQLSAGRQLEHQDATPEGWRVREAAQRGWRGHHRYPGTCERRGNLVREAVSEAEQDGHYFCANFCDILAVRDGKAAVTEAALMAHCQMSNSAMSRAPPSREVTPMVRWRHRILWAERGTST